MSTKFKNVSTSSKRSIFTKWMEKLDAWLDKTLASYDSEFDDASYSNKPSNKK